MNINFALIRCRKCNWNHEQIAVVDEPGEDCNLFAKVDELWAELRQSPRFCECGERLHVSYSASVIARQRKAVQS